MAQFLLLLRSDPAVFQGVSPEQMQSIIARYGAWSGKLRAAGQIAGSNKLKDDSGRVLRRDAGKTRVIDGPYSEAKEVMGGYFLVESKTYETAVALAQECPHVDYGTIEVREIDPM